MVNDSAAILVELGLTLLQIIDVVRETAFTCILYVGVAWCLVWAVYNVGTLARYEVSVLLGVQCVIKWKSDLHNLHCTLAEYRIQGDFTRWQCKSSLK